MVRTGPAWLAAAGLVLGAEPGRLRVGDLEGQFGAVHFDGDDELLVIADPFGMQSLFVAERDGVLLVCDSPLVLAAELGAGLDELGAAVFVRLGMQVGWRTLWTGVRRVEPGTLVRLRPGRAPSHERYWRPAVDSHVSAMRFDAAVAHCVDTLVGSFRARFAGAGPAWADLTGGYDSRLMDLALDRVGVPIATNTMTHADGRPDADTRLAEHVARIAGWPWTRLGYARDWPAQAVAEAEHALAWSGGQLPVLQLAEVLWHQRAMATTRAILFNGGGGEHFWNYAWQHELLAPSRGANAVVRRWVTVRMLSPMSRPVLRPELEAAVTDDLVAAMTRWIAPYGDAPKQTRLDLLYAYKSVGHFGAYRSAGEAHLSVRTPFYLKPVFTAAISARPVHRLNHRLMRHMMQALDPRIAALATAKGGPAQPLRASNALRFLPYWGVLARKGANKLAAATVDRTPFTFGGATGPYVAEGRRRTVEHLRAGGAFAPGALRGEPLYEPRVARALLEDPGPATVMDGLLDRVVTVELALRASEQR